MSLYGVGETYNHGFGTYNASGALADADSTPTGVLVVGGTDTGATVTITRPATGRYKIAASLAGRSVGDDCHVRYSAAVGGVTQEGRTPPFRVAFPAALSGGVLTSGTGAAQLGVAAGVADANVVKVAGVAATSSDGTAQAGGSNTITLSAAASARDNAYLYWRVRLVGGTGSDQWATVIGYVGSTRVATIRGSWATPPDATTLYDLDPPAAAGVELWAGVAAGGMPNSGGVTVSAYAVGQDPGTIVWGNTTAPTRTLTGAVTVGAYSAGQDPATLVWAAGARTLTSGANIALAKGTGVTGFNDVTAASVWAVARSGNQGAGTFGEFLDAATSTRLPSSSYVAPDNTTIAHLGTTLQTDGLGGYQLTSTALANSPAGGGGAADWTVTERAQIRYVLNIDGTAAAPSVASGAARADVVLYGGVAAEAESGTFAAVTSSTATFDAGDPFAGSFAAGMRFAVVSGTGAGPTFYTLSSVVAGNQWNVTPAWVAGQPTTSSGYAWDGPLPGLGGGLDAAGVRAAVGLAAANLDAQLGTIGGYIDTEVAAIKAKTDNLPASFPANFASLAVTAAGLVSLNPAQAGLTPRALDAVTDAGLTVGDALVAAIVGAVGDRAVVGTAFTIRTPATGTTVATKALDDPTSPTSAT